MKKLGILILFIILINIHAISAINLDVSSKPISNTFIIELNEPAVFELTIRNLGDQDSFEIYSLVGINIEHSPIFLSTGQTKKVNIELTPQESLKVKRNAPFSFEYKIKNSKNEIQKQTISINILSLESVFSIISDPIHPKSEKITLSIKNNIIFDFPKINIKTTSAFFEHQANLSLSSKEKKEFTIEIDGEKIKKLNAGNYLINSKVTIGGKTADIESQIRFLEQEGIELTKNKEGFIIQRIEIIKKNTGNVKKTITITEEKNIFSLLFTSTNIPPTKTKTIGSKKIYTWEKELIPNEELKIIIKTNWFYPIIIIVIIILAISLIRKSLHSNLELNKKVSFVRTKGGQFALKVTLRVTAKKFIERITIIDKLPPLVKLYHRFGIIEPNKIDIENKRIEWNIESLSKDETRILSYIIYSKIGVVGRFELPEAKVIYEQDGKVKEITSNRSFYINEPSG